MSNLIQRLAYKWTIAPRLKRLQGLLPDAIIHPTGSRYVCNPPVFGTDVDFIVYHPDALDSRLVTLGYTQCPWVDYQGSNKGSGFSAWRKGVINLIVSNQREFVERHVVATHYCKAKNIRDKWYRVLIHSVIRDKELDEDDIRSLSIEMRTFLKNIHGAYGNAVYAAYKIKHGVGL